LQGYVDVAVLRDIIERHGISNPVAQRWLQRHLLGNPAAPFSIQKFYDALKSQGLPISKDSLHAFLAYFEDAFLIRTTSLFTASERQRMVNPRKAYPIDPGLIPKSVELISAIQWFLKTRLGNRERVSKRVSY